MAMRASVILAASLLLLPVALAHLPPGPKNFCESSSDWSTHDYTNAPAPLPAKNLRGQPLGSYGIHNSMHPNGEDPVDSGISLGPLDGNLAGDCNGDTVPGDYDGHYEYATSGAYLAASSGGVYLTGPWAGASWGSVPCLGEEPDHTPGTTITIVDRFLNGAVGMDITSDYARDAVPADTDFTTGAKTICGDHVIEPCLDPTTDIDQATCNANDADLVVVPNYVGSTSNSGTPTFNPGQNGAYVIFVFASANGEHPGAATAGHIIN